MTTTQGSQSLPRIGWIGTGVMGLSMCGHVLAKGYPVTYAEVPDAGHAPEYWRRRLPDAIATLARFPEK